MYSGFYTPDTNASIATLLRRAQSYRNASAPTLDCTERMRAADYLEAEAIRRTNPSFYRRIAS
jgi:hypothetical protein